MRLTRSVLLTPFVCVLALVLAGCPKKKGDASDASADAEAGAAAATAPGPEASNVDAVARFPDETAIDHQAATLLWAANNVRKAPPSGEIIATLPKGTNVIQLASHDKYALVTFDNPKTSGERLMGWVIKDAFNAQGIVVPKGPCPAGQTQLLGDEIFCGKVCKADTDCPGGSACTGTAQTVLHDGGPGVPVKSCSAIVHPAGSDAGTPVVTDAGTTPRDAGGGGSGATDSGGGGGGGPMVVDPGAGGTCPAGFKMGQPDGKCHHNCTPGKDAECAVFGAGTFCTRGGYCKMR
jgi:hypothetical protein